MLTYLTLAYTEVSFFVLCQSCPPGGDLVQLSSLEPIHLHVFCNCEGYVLNTASWTRVRLQVQQSQTDL